MAVILKISILATLPSPASTLVGPRLHLKAGGLIKAEASGLVYDRAAASGCLLGAELDCGDRPLGFNATVLRLSAKSAWFVCEMRKKNLKNCRKRERL